MGSADAVSRRAFLQTASGATTAAAGATAVTATAGVASAQEAPDFDGWMSDVDNYDGIEDQTGNQTVTVAVGAQGNGGAFAFEPAVVRVDPGTTVEWEWTGEGGGHNVVAEDGPFDSGSPVASAGVNFEYTFEEAGIFEYLCTPHESLGMKGVVVVGDVDVSGGGDGGEGGAAETDPVEMGVPFQAHYVGIATFLALIISLLFTFAFLKYGTSSHANYGR